MVVQTMKKVECCPYSYMVKVQRECIEIRHIKDGDDVEFVVLNLITDVNIQPKKLPKR